jgi:hypothetical protein
MRLVLTRYSTEGTGPPMFHFSTYEHRGRFRFSINVHDSILFVSFVRPLSSRVFSNPISIFSLVLHSAFSCWCYQSPSSLASATAGHRSKGLVCFQSPHPMPLRFSTTLSWYYRPQAPSSVAHGASTRRSDAR